MDGEFPSGLLHLRTLGVRSGEYGWVGKTGLSEPAQCRVQRSPGQRSSSWSQSACSPPPRPFSSSPRPRSFLIAVPLLPASCFPLAPPPPALAPR